MLLRAPLVWKAPSLVVAGLLGVSLVAACGPTASEGEGETNAGEGEGEGDIDITPADELKVLLIGNSQLGLNPAFVGDALQDLSRRAHGGSNPLAVSTYQAFGANCDGFMNDPPVPGSVLDDISTGGYDLVVFLPSIDEQGGNEDCWDSMKAAVEDANALFGIMATGHIRASYPSGVQALHTSIKAYAESRSVLFVPAGDSWLRALGTNPSADDKNEFYANDNEHPSPEASYLYDLALYGAITQRTVGGAPNDLPALRCALPGHAPTHNFVGADATSVDDDAECASFDEYASDVDDEEVFGGSVPFNANIFDARGGGHVSIVRSDEATAYQAAVQAALDARADNTK